MNVFFEVILRKIIGGVLGYYTLYYLFKIFDYKSGIEWLENIENEIEEAKKGVFVRMVGLVSVAILFILFGVILWLLGLI